MARYLELARGWIGPRRCCWPWYHAAGCSWACSALPRRSSPAPPPRPRSLLVSAASCWPSGLQKTGDGPLAAGGRGDRLAAGGAPLPRCGPPEPRHRTDPRACGPAGVAGVRRSPLLEAHDLVFRYRERGEPVLRGCSLRLWPGERLLLEGPSGGGKSTLAALLLGCASRSRALCSSAASTARRWVPRAGGGGWWPRRSSRTTTSLPARRLQPAHGPALAAAPRGFGAGRGPVPRAGPGGPARPHAGRAAADGGRDAAGSSRRASAADSILPARCCKAPTCLVLDESFAALDPETLRQALQLCAGARPDAAGHRPSRDLLARRVAIRRCKLRLMGLMGMALCATLETQEGSR